MRTSDLDYVLPPERIAQEPLPERDASRLLVLELATGTISHRVFRDLPSLLSPGDLLVLNDTRVLPARLHGYREETGGRVEALLIQKLSELKGQSDAKPGDAKPGDGKGGGRHEGQVPRHVPGGSYRSWEGARAGHRELWLALTKSGGTLRPGEPLKLADGRARARIVERHGQQGDVISVELLDARYADVSALLDEAGHMPVPPYVRRDRRAPPSELDRERYQTAYAREEGAVAAPTAGLHFTEGVFRDLDARGVRRAFVTLHVGPGTFRPVKADYVEEHVMDAESYVIPPETVREIDECRAREGRLVAVGTTTVRTLESAAARPSPRLRRAGSKALAAEAAGESDKDAQDSRDAERQVSCPSCPSLSGTAATRGGHVQAGPGVARLFIRPGHEFGALLPGRDALLTNFHLPRGTPLFLVCAFAAAALGSTTAAREAILGAYAAALGGGYRFLSYGDAMLIV